MSRNEENVTFLDLYRALMGENGAVPKDAPKMPPGGNTADAAALAAEAVTKAKSPAEGDVLLLGGSYAIRTDKDGAREAVFVGCEEVSEEVFVVLAEVEDPKSGRPVPVREIASRAFCMAGERLKEVMLPDSVVRICDRAFLLATELVTIRMPKALEVLGEDIADMTQVAHLWIPKTVREIAKPYLCNRMSFSVEAGNPYYFTDGVGLYHVAEDGNELVAVSHSPEVTEYRVLDGTVRVADHAFDENFFLKKVMLPEGLTEIGDEAFSGCESLCSLALPKSLRAIGREAFHGCAALHRLDVGPALTSLGARCLTETFGGRRDCRGIFDVHVDADNPVLFVENDALRMGDVLVKYLGEAEEYAVPDGVKVIGEQAFLRSSVVHLSLPASLERVEKDAFWGVEALVDVTIASDSLTDGEAAKIYIPQSPTYRKTGVCEGFYAHGEGALFDYATYDASFATFHNYPDLCRMAACRLRYPFALQAEDMYREWLAEHIEDAVGDFAKREMESFHEETVSERHREILEELAEVDAISENNMDALIEIANRAGATELLMALMTMKQERFAGGFTGFDFTL